MFIEIILTWRVQFSQTQTQSTQDSQSRTDIFSHRKCFSQNDEVVQLPATKFV